MNTEIFHHNIAELAAVKLEHFLKDVPDLIGLEDFVFIVIISEEDVSQLVDDNPLESFEEGQVFKIFQEPLILSQNGAGVLALRKLSLRNNVDSFEGGDRGTAEVVLQELEVNLIGDPSVLVKIDHLEPTIDQLLGSAHLDAVEQLIDGDSKLLATHDALLALRVKVLPVPALDGHLAEMQLRAEIGQLVVAHLAVVVAVIPEHVLSHVSQLLLLLVQQTHQGRLDLVLTELLVFVLVVRNQQLPHTRTHLLGKGVISKSERLVEAWNGNRVGVFLINLLIVLRDVELVPEVVLNSEETFHPIKVLLV